MCDFSQPPPRTLRCRPVILQQQHATVLRSGPRARTLIRSPLVVARSVPSSNSTASSDESANSTNPTNSSRTATATTAESTGPENDAAHRGVGTSSVEVVIEEADTTNMQDNTDDGTPVNMDIGESTGNSKKLISLFALKDFFIIEFRTASVGAHFKLVDSFH